VTSQTADNRARSRLAGFQPVPAPPPQRRRGRCRFFTPAERQAHTQFVATLGEKAPLLLDPIDFVQYYQAQGIIGTASGIGASLSTALFGLLAASLGNTAAFLSMTSVALLGASILWLLMPETRPSIGK
jgi:hypothetical protein